MRVKFLTQSADLTVPKSGGKTPHQEKLDYLHNNPNQWDEINDQLRKIVADFFEKYHRTGNAYLNSGSVAQRVCAELGYPQDEFHHGLIGSALLDFFQSADESEYDFPSHKILIASRGEGETWINYFVGNLW